MQIIRAGIKIKQGGGFGGLHYLKKLKDLNRPTWARELAGDVGERIAIGANRFAPKSTGNLQDNAYHTSFGVNKEGPWIKVSVQNSDTVPYALYQYFGEIYGPNQAVWDLKLRKRQASVTLKHIGWVSPKGKKKFPTGRMMGKRREFATSRGFIHITGYTKNKQAKPRWLEVFMSSPKYWGPVATTVEDYLTTQAKRLIEHGR